MAAVNHALPGGDTATQAIVKMRARLSSLETAYGVSSGVVIDYTVSGGDTVYVAIEKLKSIAFLLEGGTVPDNMILTDGMYL